MKKIFSLIAVAALCGAGLVSCNKQALPEGPEAVAEGIAEVGISLNTGAVSTKAAYADLASANTSESKIQNVQIFVFRVGGGGDGELDIAASRGFDTPLNAESGWKDASWKIRCATGSRNIYAVVNDSQDRTTGAGAISTLAEFLLLQHELKNSESSKLLMLGSTGTITLTEGAQDLTINVTRYAASVVLNSITNSFTAPAYQKAGVFKLHRAYLLNVPGMINFGKTSAPGTYDINFWYAQRAIEGAGSNVPTETAYQALIKEDLGDAVLDYGAAPHTTKHVFYSYPNPCAASEDIASAYGPRATVLVLEAYVKNSAGVDNLFYYPVVLAQYNTDTHTYTTKPLESNKRYIVDLVIHRPGSDNPNIPVKFDDVTPVITVADWEAGDSYSPEI